MAALAHERLKESIEEWDLAQCQSQTEIYQSNPKTTARVVQYSLQPDHGASRKPMRTLTIGALTYHTGDL